MPDYYAQDDSRCNPCFMPCFNPCMKKDDPMPMPFGGFGGMGGMGGFGGFHHFHHHFHHHFFHHGFGGSPFGF